MLEGLQQVLIQLEGFSVFLLGGLEIPDLEMPPKPSHSLRDFPLKAVDHRMPQEIEADSSRRTDDRHALDGPGMLPSMGPCEGSAQEFS
jgi:hypothetical protein